MIRVAVMATLVVLAHGTGGFHEPRVGAGDADGDRLEVDISVLLDVSEGPVVVHLFLPREEELIPLVDRGGRRWGAVVELRRADWRVVFEDVATGVLSEQMSLTDLGLDRDLLGASAGREESEPAAMAVLPALLLAAAAAIITLAAVWASGRRRLAAGK